jgi:uncharacterized protein with NRDE domain
VCLLIALSGVVADAPLIVAANRDERYARPAVTMTVLRSDAPRVLGGRDEVAGGTWLAVNEHGLVAGLTNQPSPAGRDATKRSRGELPLAFAAYRRADQAVAEVCAMLDPADYNPCWLLVGDRYSLFSIGLTGGNRPEVEQLPPGLHILENSPLRTPSAKTAQVARMVAEERAIRASAAPIGHGPAGENASTAADALATVLRDHRPALEPPAPVLSAPVLPGTGPPGTVLPGTVPPNAAQGPPRPPAISAACVHTPDYGTRSAMVVTVPAAGPPLLFVADGPPCQVPLRDMTSLWTGPALV